MKTLNSKGQIFTVDFIFAATVFLFILTLSIIYSTEIDNRIGLLESENSRQISAQNAANALVLGTGSPGNWQEHGDLNSVSGIGLAESMNIIQAEKLNRLVDFNAGYYDEVRVLLGLAKYDLRVSVLRLQNKESVAEFGLEPIEVSDVTAVNRIAHYNGENVIVRVKVFE